MVDSAIKETLKSTDHHLSVSSQQLLCNLTVLQQIRVLMFQEDIKVVLEKIDDLYYSYFTRGLLTTCPEYPVWTDDVVGFGKTEHYDRLLSRKISALAAVHNVQQTTDYDVDADKVLPHEEK
jgi:hypothetical protein